MPIFRSISKSKLIIRKWSVQVWCHQIFMLYSKHLSISLHVCTVSKYGYRAERMPKVVPAHIFSTIAYFALFFESNLIAHWTSVPACLAQFFVLNPVLRSIFAHDRRSYWKSRSNLGHFANVKHKKLASASLCIASRLIYMHQCSVKAEINGMEPRD